MTHADQAMILPQGSIISLFNGIPTETTGARYLGDMQHHMIWFRGKALPDHVLLHRLVSDDGGTTWKRQPCNPILAGPDQGAEVTGWRDPFLTSSWNSAPESLRRAYTDEDVVYGLISGGLVDHTPTVFVYAVKKTDLTDWKYVGILADPGLNFRPSRWSGDFGKNWEVANLVTLTDDEGTSRDFVIMGTEGCLPRDDKSVQENNGSIARDGRIQRSQLWMCLENNESASSSSTLMKYSYAGIFDNGLYYAANSFWDPVSQQQIVYGWITEEDLPDPIRHRQGWSGLISLPRVLKLNTMHGVKRARATNDLRDITSIEATPDLHGTYTVRTLGVRPDRRLEKLRAKASKQTLSDTILGPMGTLGYGRGISNFLPLSTLQWEVDIEIAVGKNCSQVGFVVSDRDHIDKTVLFWDPVSETFVIERPPILSENYSNDDIKHGQGREVSPHTLFTYTTEPREDNKNNILGHAIEKSPEAEETLHIRAIFDVSVLEVFVNERTALSTRIYHAYGARQERVDIDGQDFGLYFFADHMSGESIDDPPARLLRATVWDGLSLP
ncbi:hypothetical protein ZTR_07931 [Talaromyces verruculosus]|nr:hypothetical protein ZTR_07931 [Talaromyces verruculosus]